MDTQLIDDLLKECNKKYKQVNSLDYSNDLSYLFGCTLLEFLFNNANHDDCFFSRVLMNISNINSFCLEFGLMNVKALALMYSENGKHYDTLNSQLDEMMENNLKFLIDNNISQNYDLTFGETTCCRYLLNKKKTIAYRYTQNLVDNLLKSNLEYFDKKPIDLNKEELEFLPEGYFDLGMAHGISGTLFLITDYFNLTKDSNTYSLINLIFDCIINNSYYEGNQLIIKGIENHIDTDVPIKSEYYSWCYGTLGIMCALVYANQVVSNEKIEIMISNFKKQLMETNDIELKNNSNCICHGYTGTLLMLESLFGENVFSLPVFPNLIKKIKNNLDLDVSDFISSGFSHIDGCVSELLSILLFSKHCHEKEVFYKYFISIQ